jgi:hypothetical protein
MALIKPRPQNEQEVMLALWGRLRDFIHPSDSLHQPLMDVYRLLHTQPVYVLGLRDLQSGLGSANLSCWRYLAGSSIGQAAGGEVSFLGLGNTPKLNGVIHGPEVTVAVQAADRICSQCEKKYKDSKDNYELRVLSIPGLLIEAFWCKWSGKVNPGQPDKPGATPPADYVTPFLSRSRKLEIFKEYTADQFLAIVQGMAGPRLDSAKASAVSATDPDVSTHYPARLR